MSSFLIAVLQTAETARIAATTVVESVVRGGSTREDVDRRIRRWAQRARLYSGMKVTIEGMEHVRNDETFVVMSNHQSNWDIPVIYYAFPNTLRMVAKMEMKKIPLMGRAMQVAEFVFVDRTDKRQAFKAIRQAEQTLRSGVNVWIAPEGTRSEDGRLGEFKKGGFIMALETETRILPVTLEGTRHVVPVGSPRVTRNVPVSVKFHPPVDPQRWGHDRRDELLEHVKQVIASGLPEHLRSKTDSV